MEVKKKKKKYLRKKTLQKSKKQFTHLQQVYWLFVAADYFYSDAVFRAKFDVSELQFEELNPDFLYVERKLNAVGYDLRSIDYK